VQHPTADPQGRMPVDPLVAGRPIMLNPPPRKNNPPRRIFYDDLYFTTTVCIYTLKNKIK